MITITISGLHGDGKTTLAQALGASLALMGWNVTINDDLRKNYAPDIKNANDATLLHPTNIIINTQLESLEYDRT